MSRWRTTRPDDASIGAAPASMAEAASERSRPGCDQLISTWAAVTGPHARPQAELANSFHQYRNADDAFAVTGTVPRGPVLLVDDVRGSGWTLTTVAGQLRDAGAGAVHPLVLLSGWPTPDGARSVQGKATALGTGATPGP